MKEHLVADGGTQMTITIDRAVVQQALKSLRGYRREINCEQPCDAERALEAALLDEYHAALVRWGEANGQPYVSGFGKD
jgi:hypothetical protein